MADPKHGQIPFPTIHHSQVVNILTSYSEGPGFKYWLGDRLYLLALAILLSRLRAMPRKYLKLSYDRFHPRPMHFVIHVSSIP
jgi:hypothetical protein